MKQQFIVCDIGFADSFISGIKIYLIIVNKKQLKEFRIGKIVIIRGV